MKSRKRIPAEYIALGIICLLTVSIVSTWIKDLQYVPERNVHWRPRNDIFSILPFTPIGMLLHLFLPTGWIFWLEFGLAVYQRNRGYYIA